MTAVGEFRFVFDYRLMERLIAYIQSYLTAGHDFKRDG